VLGAASANGHEVWLSPNTFFSDLGQEVQIDVRNGQNFVGISLPYSPRSFARVMVHDRAGIRTVGGRLGDIPALTVSVSTAGPMVIGYVSTVSTIRYASWDKFQAFVDEKNLGEVLPRHRARGLPEAGFIEAYTRYAKTLIGSRAIAGRDQPLGLTTEIVLLDDLAAPNPRAQVLLRGEPRRAVQVEVFTRHADGSVTLTELQSDQEGIVQLTTESGAAYLLNTVTLEPVDDTVDSTMDRVEGAVWSTLWASLTFAVP
jgi:hypothetical protein